MRYLPNFKLIISGLIFTALITACSQSTSLPGSSALLQCEGLSDWSFLTSNEYSEVTVHGTVQGVFQSEDQFGGAFIQQTHSSASNENISRGVFVRTEAPLEEGQYIAVRGAFSEFLGGKQITADSLIHCGSREVSSIELVFPPTGSQNLEPILHQRIHLAQPMYVVDNYNLARFGILTLADALLTVPTQKVTPGHEAAALAASNQGRQIVLDNGSQVVNSATIHYPPPQLTADNTVRRGDRVTHIEGVLTKIGDRYHIQPTTAPVFEATNPRPTASDLFRRGDLRVATFNVLNYFNGDGLGGGFPTPRGAKSAQEFERQHARIVNALVALDADIYALMEMENDGYASTSAIRSLVDGLQSAMPEAEFSFVNPGTDRIGGDVITQALIYRSDRVQEIGQAAFSEHSVFSLGSRPPFAQSFAVNDTGGVITVVANHFKSKGRCPNDDSLDANQGDGQSCWNALRTRTAEQLAHWVGSHPTGIAQPSVLLTGDFNAYAQEDPITLLTQLDYTDLAGEYAEGGYSYVFRGEAGSLDHTLAHSSLLPAVRHFAYWAINADEPIALEYPVANKTEWQQSNWYSEAPYRSSDHDPIYVDFDSTLLPKVAQ